MDAPLPSKLVPHLAMLINMLSMGSLMMVMPLGPDFVMQLDMPATHVGYLCGGATLAAALSAAASAAWLDRLPRKSALVSLIALRFTLLLACALATTPSQLIVLFVLAGLVSGPMGALLMAALLDLIPPQQRGRQLAWVGMGFPLAAIIVVPLALELALRWDWTAPFALCGLLGLLLGLLCHWLLPSPPRHAGAAAPIRNLLSDPLCQGALAIVAVQLFGHFLLVPHFSPFFQFNLQLPREQLGLLYLGGGLASLLSMRLAGGWLDQGAALAVVLGSSSLLALASLAGLALPLGLPLWLTFTLFMALSSVRSSSTLTVIAAIPPASQRAAFMAFQGTVSNVAAGLGSLASALYLTSASDGRLQGFPTLVWINACAVLLAAAALAALLRAIARREATREIPEPAITHADRPT